MDVETVFSFGVVVPLLISSRNQKLGERILWGCKLGSIPPVKREK